VLGALPPDMPSVQPSSQAVAKDMEALSKLVNASIAALRNAANASSNNNSSISSASLSSQQQTHQQSGSLSQSHSFNSSSRPPGPPRVPIDGI